jgi:hypothetical protein
MAAGQYDVAQICSNGHIITRHAIAFSDLKSNFCPKCGAATIMKCPGCGTQIRGEYDVPGIMSLSSDYKMPWFCHNCGKPYPWTESRIQAAKELIELEDKFSDAEKIALAADLPDLIRDTPRTQVAATRFKKLAAKAAGGVASALRDIIVDVASEAAKKTILGP